MRTFLVESHLLAMEPRDLLAAQRATSQTCARLTSQGHPVRYLEAIYIPADGRYLCMFEAVDEATVRRVTEVTQLPCERVLTVTRLEM